MAKIKKGEQIIMMSNNSRHEVERVGIFTPKPVDIDEIGPGEIGFIVTGIKDLSDTKVGDTITTVKNSNSQSFTWFQTK